eukprot:augustus_masked-scaffold_66-processed-gene-0.87-mRNA-1 protein AED:1.00 eAED:1.00 QI:0/0/0/0/1/1/3/0/181
MGLKRRRGEALVEDEFGKKKSSEMREGTITSNQAQELENILLSHLEAFGLKIAKCDFNNLTPMKIKLHEELEEYVNKAYQMSNNSMEALGSKLKELENMGMIRREPNPFFSSPVFMVPTRGNRDEYRMEADLRRCNRSVKPTGAGLPNLETPLAWFKDTERYFGSFDGISGFDNLRVECEA